MHHRKKTKSNECVDPIQGSHHQDPLTNRVLSKCVSNTNYNTLQTMAHLLCIMPSAGMFHVLKD